MRNAPLPLRVFNVVSDHPSGCYADGHPHGPYRTDLLGRIFGRIAVRGALHLVLSGLRDANRRHYAAEFNTFAELLCFRSSQAQFSGKIARRNIVAHLATHLARTWSQGLLKNGDRHQPFWLSRPASTLNKHGASLDVDYTGPHSCACPTLADFSSPPYPGGTLPGCVNPAN